MSRIGRTPIQLPDKVKVTFDDGGAVQVEGPKGKLAWQLPGGVSAEIKENTVSLARQGDSRQIRAKHGLSRALLANMIAGVSEGFKKNLEIQGVGFRAAVQGNVLNLSLGKSHPINFPIPDGIRIAVTDNTKISVEGIDRQVVGQVAADIRSYYPPEPYKGKGVRYEGEQVRRKEGKKQA